ncbi:MAG: DUF1080 domain-containing protein [Marinoscillum sp.]
MSQLKNLLLFFISLALVGCTSSKTEEQTQEEWINLFNGQDLDGWTAKFHHHEPGDNYANTFRVVDGKIRVSYDDYDTFDNRFGHLFYDQPFSSFHLKFTYRFTDQLMEDAPDYVNRNSGVMFHSQNPKTILKEQDWPICVEYQILADEDKGPRPTGNMCSPATHVVYQGELDPQHCINSTSETYPWDQWIHGELIVYGDSIIYHVVEGDTVLQYSKPQIGGEVASGFDPAIKVDGTPLKEGFIALQAEGQGIEFKDIFIREL